jgi:hypothetical protein
VRSERRPLALRLARTNENCASPAGLCCVERNSSFFTAKYAHTSLERLSAQLANASPDQGQARVDASEAQLRSLWGDGFKARVDAIDEFVAGIGGSLGDALVEGLWLVAADALLMTMIDSLLQARKHG